MTSICKSDAMKTRSAIDLAKKAAAYAAGEQHVRSGYRIGVGSGTTAKFFVEFLAEKVNSGTLKDIICVPSSFSTRQWLIDSGLEVTDLEKTLDLDVCVDGADEVDFNLNCIKGGGGCLTQEKIVQASSRNFYIIADASKQSEKLGNRNFPIPVEVIPFGYAPVLNWIKHQEGGEIGLRMNCKEKLGPFITDNNNFILDWNFPKNKYVTTKDLAALHTRLVSLPGVVETGLFIGVAEKAYFGSPDGSVAERVRPDQSLSSGWFILVTFMLLSGSVHNVHCQNSQGKSMEAVLEALLFTFIDPPNVKISPPRWLKMPSPMQVFGLVMMTYFFVTGGVIYDIINEPPSIGQTTDERGNAKPVAIMQYRVNGQYIMEGLAASFMFSLGGLGFIILDKCNNPLTPKLDRIMMLGLGFACVLIGFLATRLFMKIKMPSYLQGLMG